MGSLPAARNRVVGGARTPAGFTLVELLVVIGIIAVLIGILIPSLTKARAAAVTLKCLSQMNQIGVSMAMYANSNRGYLFPTDAGGPSQGVDPDKQWFVYVLNAKGPPDKTDLKPIKWVPLIMRCPADVFDGSPVGVGGQENDHSYILNDHLNSRRIKVSSRLPGGVSPSDAYVMGEKKTDKPDFYVQAFPPGNTSDYYRDVLDFKRHGKVGSNYLFLDGHAATAREPVYRDPAKQLDPWDPGSDAAEGRNLKWPWWEPGAVKDQ